MEGQYALGMGGIDFNFGQDFSRVGLLQFDGSGSLALAELVNASSLGVGAQPPQGGGLTGTYQIDSSTGRIVANLSNSSGPLGLAMSAVSGSQAYVMQAVPAGYVTSGTVSLQH